MRPLRRVSGVSRDIIALTSRLSICICVSNSPDWNKNPYLPADFLEFLETYTVLFARRVTFFLVNLVEHQKLNHTTSYGIVFIPMDILYEMLIFRESCLIILSVIKDKRVMMMIS